MRRIEVHAGVGATERNHKFREGREDSHARVEEHMARLIVAVILFLLAEVLR